MPDWLEHRRDFLTIFLLAAIVFAGALWWERRPLPHDLTISPPPPSNPARSITVDVDGAVARPGLYTLQDGSRVADAIAAAGGPAPDADMTRINRALKLKDEQQVRIPRATSMPPVAGTNTTGSAPSGARLIDVNTASVDDLDSLPGIGPVTAKRILDYREHNGPFALVDQLKDSKLVNAATYERIKDLIVAR